MHRPPAVSWNVVAVRWPLRALALSALLAIALLLAFAAKQGWSPLSLGLLLLHPVSFWAAFRGLQAMPKGQLQWDGERWYWAGVDVVAVTSLVRALDLQSVMLLHIQTAQGPGFWLWLEHGADATRWLAMRRALVLSPYALDAELIEPLR
jgi:hypothetical protein